MFQGNDLPDFGKIIAFALVGYFAALLAGAAVVGFLGYCVYHTLVG